MRRCVHCGGQKLYRLSDGRLKCAACRKKLSPRRLERDQKVLECFCRRKSALECAAELGMGYRSVLDRFMEYRRAMAAHMERDFAAKKRTVAYDEYLYLDPSKRRDKRNIFDAHNLLTFHYDGKIYNLLLPDLSRFKPAMVEDGLEGVYYREFERFMRRSRITSSRDALIERFWDSLEEFFARYRGVNRQNFIYYLKEAEFLFNFDCKKLRSVVTAQPPGRGRR